jgi:hypothetical protein
MRTTAFILILILAAATAHAEPPSPALSTLSWMTGYWTGGDGDAIIEEIWLAPSGGVMVGVHRDVSGPDDVFYEYLRIVSRPLEGIYYVAKPSNQPSAEFKARIITHHRVVFENLEHDYPKRITYELDGDVLTVTIGGTVKGEERSSSWVMKRASLEQEEE